MDKGLIVELTKMTDVDFYTLEHHFMIARMVRDAMTKNGKTKSEMANILGIPENKMVSVINGSYPFDLMFLSKIQAYQQEVAYKNTKLKIEAESVGFPPYKDNEPFFMGKVEKLISLVEKIIPNE